MFTITMAANMEQNSCRDLWKAQYSVMDAKMTMVLVAGGNAFWTMLEVLLRLKNMSM